MKTIYTCSIISDNTKYSDDKFKSEIRVFANILYDTIYNYDVKGITPLDINESIYYNEIYDGKRDGEYYMSSDIDPDESVYYEPFIIGSNTCGFTIDDELIDNATIEEFIQETLYLLKSTYNLKSNCQVVIHKVSYYSKNSSDESRREYALSKIYHSLGIERKKITPQVKFIKKLLRKKNHQQSLTPKLLGYSGK